MSHVSSKTFLIPKSSSNSTKDIFTQKSPSSSFSNSGVKAEFGLFSAGKDNKLIVRTDYPLCNVAEDGNCGISAINKSMAFITGKQNIITRDTLAQVCDSICKLIECTDNNIKWKNILKNCFKNFNAFWHVLTYEKNINALRNIYCQNFESWEDFFKYLQLHEKTIEEIKNVIHSKVELVLYSPDGNGLLEGAMRKEWTRENYHNKLSIERIWVDLKELAAIANYLGFVEYLKYNHKTGGIVVIWKNEKNQQIGVHLNNVKLKDGNIQIVNDGPNHFQAVNGNNLGVGAIFQPNAIDKMNINFDDSSDEETVEDSIKRYDIKLRWREYVNNKSPNNEHSFLLHAVGVSILYSNEVNRIYYPLKAEYLYQDTYPIVKQMIYETLVEVASVIAKKIIDFEYNADYNLEDYINEIKNLIQESEEPIQQYVEELIKVPHILRATKQDDLNEVANEMMSKYIDFIFSYIQDYVVIDQELKKRDTISIEQFEDSNNISKRELNKRAIEIAKSELRKVGIIPATGDKFTTQKKDRGILFNNINGYKVKIIPRKPNKQSFNNNEHAIFNSKTKNLHMLQNGNVVELIINDKEIKKKLSLLKNNDELKKLLDSNINYFTSKGLVLYTSYPELIRYTGRIASNLNKGASIGNPFCNDVKFNIGKAYLSDLIRLNNNQPLKTGTKAWEASTKIEGIEQFFPYSDEMVKYNINKEFFSIFFKKLLEKIALLERKTFNLTHTFISHNGLEFLANLRLSNREQTRTIKNLKHVPILTAKNNGASPKKKHIQYRTWSFSSQEEQLEAIERQQIILSSKGRYDWVDNGGSYQDVYSEIKNIKTYFKKFNFKVVDINIAIWVRQIINSQPLENIDSIDSKNASILMSDKKHLKNFLVGIAYLICGNEVARNPASLAINQMMLDLIIAEKMTWEDALTKNKLPQFEDGGKMPMSPKDAISAARKLHSGFNSNMPFPYEYKGNSTTANYSANDMSERESSLYKLWLEHIAPEYDGENLSEQFIFIQEYSKKYWFFA